MKLHETSRHPAHSGPTPTMKQHPRHLPGSWQCNQYHGSTFVFGWLGYVVLPTSPKKKSLRQHFYVLVKLSPVEFSIWMLSVESYIICIPIAASNLHQLWQISHSVVAPLGTPKGQKGGQLTNRGREVTTCSITFAYIDTSRHEMTWIARYIRGGSP